MERSSFGNLSLLFLREAFCCFKKNRNIDNGIHDGEKGHEYSKRIDPDISHTIYWIDRIEPDFEAG